jgi:hypothetical protein
MTTNWRELRDSRDFQEAFSTFNTISLGVPKNVEKESEEDSAMVKSADSAKSPQKPLGNFRDPQVNSVKSAESLEADLLDRGILIAIDKQTGSALLLFKDSDAQIVRDSADVYKPFGVSLTPTQRRELLDDLDYYETLLDRKGLVRKALE